MSRTKQHKDVSRTESNYWQELAFRLCGITGCAWWPDSRMVMTPTGYAIRACWTERYCRNEYGDECHSLAEFHGKEPQTA